MPYIDGVSREQIMLLPRTVDEYVSEDNPVRAIDAFINYLNFDELGFVRAEALDRGRPGYDPRVLMGIYIWGHFNGIRSSRRLERECGRNLELMWLTGELQPDFKTLCRFRQQNGKAIRGVLAEFRAWAKTEGLYGKELVAIDGSKFKAVNSKARSYTPEKIRQIIARETAEVEQYLADLEQADSEETEHEEQQGLTGEELREKIARLKTYLDRHERIEQKLKETGETQYCETDPDARMMRTSQGSTVAYNVQMAVDDKYKLIVDMEVTNERADQGLLAEMAKKSKETLGVEELKVVADGGYFAKECLQECEENQITAFIRVPELGTAERRGLYTREEFTYCETQDIYVCPAGAELRVTSKGTIYNVYSTSKCGGCALRLKCTTSKKGRKIKRWVNQETLDRLLARMRDHPEVIKQRKALVEHPFGTIKVSMNHERFLTKGLENVGTEIRLAAISYNLKRVMSIFGVRCLIDKLNFQPV
jgi:transposase